MNHPHHSHENHEPQHSPGRRGHAGHALMMIACVVLMGGAAALLMWRGQSLGSGAWLLLPMALCMGMHLLMHRHGHHHRDD